MIQCARRYPSRWRSRAETVNTSRAHRSEKDRVSSSGAHEKHHRHEDSLVSYRNPEYSAEQKLYREVSLLGMEL